MFQVVLAVDRQVVLQRVDRILGLFPPLCVFGGFDDDVGDTVAHPDIAAQVEFESKI